MTSHTPGPWHGRPHHDPIYLQGCDEAGLSIAFSCGGGNPRRSEFMANARLIAAAPEILDCLRVLVKTMDDEVPGAHSWAAVIASRTAIAKATGTTS